MTATQMLSISGALVAVMFGLLATVLGWLGSRLYSKLDEMGKTLHQIAGDLHARINGLDQRVTRVEVYQFKAGTRDDIADRRHEP